VSLNIPVSFDKRPPFLRFEEREYGRNVEASEAAGRPIPRVVVMACITPFGSKDCFEKPAIEWLEQIREKATKGEYPHEWAIGFRNQYDEYLKGNELPREGTPTATWQMASREQQIRLKALDITTVEDLALIPDNALGMIGLDGRILRDTAKSWIAESKDKGVVAQELNKVRSENESLKETVAKLSQRVDELIQGTEQKRGPGRPRKED
jgi:hypothetical protein